jgi:hypothetical protein
MSFPLDDGIHTTPGAGSLITGQRKLAPPPVNAVAYHALSQSRASPASPKLRLSSDGFPMRLLLGAVLSLCREPRHASSI